MNIKIKTADIIIICIFFIFSSTVFTLYSVNQKKGKLVIISTPKGKFEYTLNKNRKLRFKGAISDVIILIKDGKVGFIHSLCKNKICIQMGFTNKAGALISCVPNKVSVYIKSSKENEVDVRCR